MGPTPPSHQLLYIRLGRMSTAAPRCSVITPSYSSQLSCSSPAATKIARRRGRWRGGGLFGWCVSLAAGSSGGGRVGGGGGRRLLEGSSPFLLIRRGIDGRSCRGRNKGCGER